jgi:serine phosphatase RsbU (regulator of sigma subunit)
VVIERPMLALLALVAAGAVVVWGRSARRLLRGSRRIAAAQGQDAVATELARSAFLKDLHAAGLYVVVALVALAEALTNDERMDYVLWILALPALVSLRYASTFLRHARLTESRSQLEQRAEEVLVQEALAPRRWTARLAPDDVAELEGFEIGTLYRAGTGMMAGDFYDVLQTSRTRVAAVIGDVSGHGIDASITAFQAKHLLRVFLQRYRDPAQALEELNGQMTTMRSEEFISMAVVLFDTEAGTLRYASAGHPAAFVWHDGDVRTLEATGPIIALTGDAEFASRELALDHGDLVLLYTDGLAEARAGDQLFGEDRIAAHLRRDPGADPSVLCKTLMEAAEDFATVPLSDDTAILAIRRT